MELMLRENTCLNLQGDRFNNCHQFTMDFILSLFNSELYPQDLDPQFMVTDLQTIYNNRKSMNEGEEGIRNLYYNMINNGATPFDKSDMNAVIQSCSLIIFVGSKDHRIGHSMIALNSNEWIGANNICSLGPRGSVKLSEDIQGYTDMSERYFVGGNGVETSQVQGGWQCNRDTERYEIHYCTLDVEAVMFAVPLFAPGNSTSFDLSYYNQSGDNGCCLIF